MHDAKQLGHDELAEGRVGRERCKWRWVRIETTNPGPGTEREDEKRKGPKAATWHGSKQGLACKRPVRSRIRRTNFQSTRWPKGFAQPHSAQVVRAVARDKMDGWADGLLGSWTREDEDPRPVKGRGGRTSSIPVCSSRGRSTGQREQETTNKINNNPTGRQACSLPSCLPLAALHLSYRL